ncbi:MAG: hypothetical protein RSH78_00205 [Bacilli bacterium]
MVDFEVKGMQELIDKLQHIQDTPRRIGNKVLNDAAKVVKEVETNVAYNAHRPYSEDVGHKEIKKFGIRTYRSGAKYVDIGLRGSGADWSKIKGLYFNNYGFYHNKSGRYIAGSNWIEQAYEQSREDAYKIIKDGLIREMRL